MTLEGLGLPSEQMSVRSALARHVEDFAPQIIELRRLLHRHPEPASQEHRTTEIIAGTLAGHGIEADLCETGTGLWADIGGVPKVGFRADIDALPIMEPSENDPRSEIPGWMHACGHDAHAAVAVGIALVLSRLDLPFGARILVQPAEESLSGGGERVGGRGCR